MAEEGEGAVSGRALKGTARLAQVLRTLDLTDNEVPRETFEFVSAAFLEHNPHHIQLLFDS
jgi:hypothetical protein